jgi:hypothetical protein
VASSRTLPQSKPSLPSEQTAYELDYGACIQDKPSIRDFLNARHGYILQRLSDMRAWLVQADSDTISQLRKQFPSVAVVRTHVAAL